MDRLSCDSSGTLVRLFQRPPIFNAKNQAECEPSRSDWVVKPDHYNEQLKNTLNCLGLFISKTVPPCSA